MIVFDLNCLNGHRFEAWFRSSSDFTEQQARNLVTCPQCGIEKVEKAPMAPAVPVKGNRATHKDVEKGSRDAESAPKDSEPSLPVAKSAVPNLPPEVKQKFEAAVRQFAKAQSEVLKKSEWVGDKFADASRKIHYGEANDKPIHGKATAKEARELLEEGISIAPIIVPFAPPDEVN